MNTTIDSLKNLYVELGGNLTDTYEDIASGAPISDYVVIPNVIDALSKIGGSGSKSSLPAVTTDDNGAFLRVVDGAWAKAIVPVAESEEY